jgi:hypothetical protein
MNLPATRVNNRSAEAFKTVNRGHKWCAVWAEYISNSITKPRPLQPASECPTLQSKYHIGRSKPPHLTQLCSCQTNWEHGDLEDLLVSCQFPESSFHSAPETRELNFMNFSRPNLAVVSWIYSLISSPVARKFFQLCFGLKGNV